MFPVCLPVDQKKKQVNCSSEIKPLSSKNLGKNQHPHVSLKLLKLHFYQDLRADATLPEASGKNFLWQ